MTREELRQEIQLLHFPDIPEETLPTSLLNTMIQKAYDEVVTRQHTYSVTADVSLTAGVYDLDGLSGFYEPRWYYYDSKKMRPMNYDHMIKVPTSVTTDVNGRRLYYENEKKITVMGLTDETVSVTYWSYPATITKDATVFTALDDQFSDVIVDRVCWKIAQGKDPKRVNGYIAGYNEHLRKVKEHYIKKFKTGRGHIVPMDF